jgi:hypothetical protein
VLPASGRDRLSIWVAEHRWAVPLMRLAVGLGLVGVSVLVFGADLGVAKVIGVVVGAAFGGKAGEREKERGDRLLETLFPGGGLPAASESVPSEFAEHVRRPRDPRWDGPSGRMGSGAG